MRELPQRPLGIDPGDGIRLSLAGAQPKLPVVLEAGDVAALPVNSAAPTTHILKPEPERFQGLVDNEAFCMDLAHQVGLPVARVFKRATASGLPYLQVERYDRELTAEPIRRLHQEDLCQALGFPSHQKYQAEGGPSVADAVSLLRRSSARAAADLITFWRALLFNWLVGNCDAHGKNYALLYDGANATLAPLYDLVSTAVYPELTTRLAMSIDGATRAEDVDANAWLELADQVDFSRRFAAREAGVLAARVSEASQTLLAGETHQNDTALAIAQGAKRRASQLAG